MLLRSIVVAGDDAGSDVDILPDGRITQISEMLCFCCGADRRFLELHEVADLDLIADHAFRPQARKRTKRNVFADGTVVQNATLEYCRPISDLHVRHPVERPDSDVLANHGLPVDLNGWVNNAVRTDLNVGVDKCAFRIDDRHAVGHQLFTLPSPHQAIHDSKLLARVYAENFLDRGNLECANLFALVDENADDICEVILALSVVISNPG